MVPYPMMLARLLFISACTEAPLVDPCGEAWQEMASVREELLRLNPSVHGPSQGQESFLAACKDLPPEAMRCVSLRVRIASPDRCRKALDTVPTEVRDRFAH
jgi:hypothetical protein